MRNYPIWTEPTAGIQYTRWDYASNADQLGLAAGSVLRLQAGERFGVESTWDAVQMTTVFTGLLYDNVAVNGGVLQNAPKPADPLRLRRGLPRGLLLRGREHAGHPPG